MRIGTANAHDTALEQLYKRQSEMASQQEKLGTGLKVNRASDNPAAAAQSERALMRMSRIETDQRALEVQRNAIATSESALGDAGSLMQGIRDLVLQAANATNSTTDRTTLAKQMSGLRDQLFALANRTDSNGVALFGGLGNAGTPFADLAGGVQFQADAGQRAATATALPGTMDGQAIFMNVPTGNGVFQSSLGPANTGALWTTAGNVTSPTALTGQNYSVTFSVVNGVTTYDVVNTTTTATVVSGQPYVDNTPIQFDGMSIVAHGVPQNGDTVTVAPSTRSDIFKVIDDAIAGIRNMPGGNQLSQSTTLALVQIDTGMERLQSARSQAGDWLNRADSITSSQEANTIALEADRVRAVGLDQVKTISDFNESKTGYETALQSYAQIQRLSLFNYIN